MLVAFLSYTIYICNRRCIHEENIHVILSARIPETVDNYWRVYMYTRRESTCHNLYVYTCNSRHRLACIHVRMLVHSCFFHVPTLFVMHQHVCCSVMHQHVCCSVMHQHACCSVMHPHVRHDSCSYATCLMCAVVCCTSESTVRCSVMHPHV